MAVSLSASRSPLHRGDPAHPQVGAQLADEHRRRRADDEQPERGGHEHLDEREARAVRGPASPGGQRHARIPMYW
jgi:hypothetical protein